MKRCELKFQLDFSYESPIDPYLTLITFKKGSYIRRLRREGLDP